MKDAKSFLSPAKVNLVLRVGPKRKDSYHEIASLMMKLPWGDRLDFKISPSSETKIFISCTRAELENENNLAVRAAHLFSRTLLVSFEFSIHIQKNIPMQGGLGGGSSNAASVLKFLTSWYLESTKASKQKMRQTLYKMGAELGSDVPFFFEDAPAAWCTGRGEKIQGVDLRSWPMVLVFPQSTISTAWAYKELDLLRRHQRSFWQFSRLQPEWLSQSELTIPFLENDFEVLALGEFEELRRLKQDLMESKAVAGQMTGSGSCFFGVYDTNSAAERAARWLNSRGWRVQKVSMGE